MKRKILLAVILVVAAAAAWFARFPPSRSLAKALVSTNDNTRNLALSQIKDLNAAKKSKLVDDLLQETNTPDTQKKIFALYGLRKTNTDKEKIFPVVLAFLDDDDGRVRQEAMIGLSEMGSAVAPKLLDLLPKKTGRTRDGMVQALIAMGKSALPDFYAGLKNQDPIIRAHAAAILGQITPKVVEAVPELLPLLKDSDSLVRRKAAISINLLAPDRKETLPAHVENIKRKTWDEDAIAATRALGALGTNAKIAMPDLNVLLKTGNDSLKNKNAQRPLLAETVNKIDPRRNGLVGYLWDLKGKDTILRYRAAYAISELTPPDPGALPDLLRAMDDKDVFVRARATVAAARVGFDKSERLKADLTKKAAESLTVVKEEQVEGFSETIQMALNIKAPPKTDEEAHIDTAPTPTAP